MLTTEHCSLRHERHYFEGISRNINMQLIDMKSHVHENMYAQRQMGHIVLIWLTFRICYQRSVCMPRVHLFLSRLLTRCLFTLYVFCHVAQKDKPSYRLGIGIWFEMFFSLFVSCMSSCDSCSSDAPFLLSVEYTSWQGSSLSERRVLKDVFMHAHPRTSTCISSYIDCRTACSSSSVFHVVFNSERERDAQNIVKESQG